MSCLQSQHRFLLAPTSLLTVYVLLLTSGFGQAAPQKATPRKPVSGKGRLKPGHLPPLQTSRAALAPPVPQSDDLLIYDGQAPNQSNLSVSAWGGGAAADNNEVSFSKGHSLKITTLDPYQGAKISLQKPVDLGSGTDPARVMIFMLRLTADTRNFRAGEGIHFQNRPRMTLAQFPQGRPPRNFTPPGMSPYELDRPGFSPIPQAAPLPPQLLSAVHLIFTRADGSQADVLRPYPNLSQTDTGGDAEQWVPISVPLAALHFASGAASSPLQSIILAGNDYAVLYLGQIRVTRDTTPITCFAGEGMTVSVGEAVTLHGNAGGGASSLKYSWDFDASDGITDQAAGPTVTTRYLQPKDYIATLTVSDIDGLKKPAVSTVTIHVQ